MLDFNLNVPPQVDAPPIAPATIPEYPPFAGLPDHCPAIVELKARPQWVAWRYEVRDETRLTKPPINPHAGRYASNADPADWGTSEQAAERARADALPGIGFVLTSDDNITGFDLDNARNPSTGRIRPWAREILNLAETYAEVSPSGKGIRLFAHGKIPAAIKCDPAGVEVYSGGRYLTVTGNHIEGTPTAINEAPRTLAACQRRAELHRQTWAALKKAGPNITLGVLRGELILPRAERPEEPKLGAIRQALLQQQHGGGRDPFWSNVNTAALQHLGTWVPALFGASATFQPGTGAYRVSSRKLGRDLQEDLSIHPNGIRDWGTEKPRTPIDLVIEHGNAPDAVAAARWLCERMVIDPVSLGWKSDPAPKTPTDEPAGQVAEILRLSDWLARDLPVPDLVQGSILSTTSRALLWAPTGLGKTLLCMALGMAASAGSDFLGWQGHRKRRVLYIDGEMPRSLMKERLRDESNRLGTAPEDFFILSHEDVEGFAPLNTAEGQAQIERVMAATQPEFIYFDNIMSLILGDMKDEEGWRQIMPWVLSLTRRQIGQLWVHHTGHETSHGYGTKTREWQMDTVIGLSKAERDDTDVAFLLTFHKARLRTPATRADFTERKVALVDDRWTYSEAGKEPKPLSSLEQKFLDALRVATIGNEANKMYGRPAASLANWQAECVKRGLLEMEQGKSVLINRSRALFGRYRLILIAENRIACNDTMAWML